jgi:hypothetical protein
VWLDWIFFLRCSYSCHFARFFFLGLPKKFSSNFYSFRLFINVQFYVEISQSIFNNLYKYMCDYNQQCFSKILFFSLIICFVINKIHIINSFFLSSLFLPHCLRIFVCFWFVWNIIKNGFLSEVIK